MCSQLGNTLTSKELDNQHTVTDTFYALLATVESDQHLCQQGKVTCNIAASMEHFLSLCASLTVFMQLLLWYKTKLMLPIGRQCFEST